MTQLVIFPDAVDLVRTHLAAALDVPIVHDVPTPRPPSFVTVRRGGGVRHTIISDAAQLLIESWADRAEDAMDLAQLARAHLNALPGQVLDDTPVYRVEELAGPADLPDPLSDQQRATFTVLVHLRGSTAVGS